MCSATGDALAAIEAATVGVFAFVTKDGGPRACAVTPYVVDERAVVSSTLAFTAKTAAVRRDPRAALLAGGCLVRGAATVDIDLTSRTFDAQLRSQELRKYPPSRQLLAVPGHRRLLPWYVGRSNIRLRLDDGELVPGSDRLTVTFLDEVGLRIVPLDPQLDLDADTVPVPLEVTGPACLLVHDEDDDMAELRQLRLDGAAADGALRVERRTGTLDATSPTTLDQLRTLRHLARQGRHHRPTLRRWADQTRSDS